MLVAVKNAGLNKHQTDPRLLATASGMNESVGADGGFAVGQDNVFNIRTQTYASGELLKRVHRHPVGRGKNGVSITQIADSSRADGQRHGGVQVYWVPEAGQKTPTRPTLRGPMTLKYKKLAALVRATDELLDDAPGLESYVNHALPDELRLVAERSILTGSGAGQPLGILNSNAVIEVAPEPGQSPSFSWTNVLDMWDRLPLWARPNAVWFINQSVERFIYQMYMPIGTGGIPVFLPADTSAGRLYPELMGRPVIPIEYAPRVGTKGDVLLADLSSYWWIDAGDVQSAKSIHVYFDTDETAFRFVWRVDGAPEWDTPYTPMDGGPTQAPVVVLGTRT
jgi:HK97 family phage major capsid protein